MQEETYCRKAGPELLLHPQRVIIIIIIIVLYFLSVVMDARGAVAPYSRDTAGG